METMSEQSVIHNTFVIERSYPLSAADGICRLRAIQESSAAGSPKGTTTKSKSSPWTSGSAATERTAYRFKEGTPFPGVPLVSEGSYLDIVPNQRIVPAANMAIGGKRISAAMVTIELLPTEKGTDLICTHQAAFFEGADGPQMRQAWMAQAVRATWRQSYRGSRSGNPCLLGKSVLTSVLHALSDPTRREIVEMLSDKPYSVSRLADPFGMTLTAVMQHLQILENSGLVRTEKTGRVRTASLVTGGFRPFGGVDRSASLDLGDATRPACKKYFGK